MIQRGYDGPNGLIMLVYRHIKCGLNSKLLLLARGQYLGPQGFQIQSSRFSTCLCSTVYKSIKFAFLTGIFHDEKLDVTGDGVVEGLRQRVQDGKAGLDLGDHWNVCDTWRGEWGKHLTMGIFWNWRLLWKVVLAPGLFFRVKKGPSSFLGMFVD